MPEAKTKLYLFHYLILLELYFYVSSHSSSKHQLSLSESTDKEIDILPSKVNLATANLNSVSKGVQGSCSNDGFSEGCDFDKVIADWEHVGLHGPWWWT